MSGKGPGDLGTGTEPTRGLRRDPSIGSPPADRIGHRLAQRPERQAEGALGFRHVNRAGAAEQEIELAALRQWRKPASGQVIEPGGPANHRRRHEYPAARTTGEL